jgi:murein DD-endopeptidase MepM/ murein hydrolase activator NlpD
VRTLVWWIDVPADLRKGDQIEALFAERNGDIVVDAVRFRSGKLGRTLRAYRYQAPSAPFARIYTPDGAELELRLKDAPIDDYEQVTSLLRDGRGHKGVDFKTPLGSPVKSTFDGRVVRKTWNFRGNGNSLELHENGGKGRRAMFLHLSELPGERHIGEHVRKGELIARSGNTGHSFAPHLHYQLMSASGIVLDPFAVQETWRKRLPEEGKVAFDAEVHKLDSLLDAAAKK